MKSNMFSQPTKVPSAPLRTFRSIVPAADLEILLETDACGNVFGIDLPSFKEWLQRMKKGFLKGDMKEICELQLNETFKINPFLHSILIRGFKIYEGPDGKKIFICSPLAPTWIIISIKDYEPLLTSLEYVYHMETCI